ncbi:FtsX-like permease family protein [Actinoplanes sp. NPDC023801]|uniref:ABC transporter permease n=1 Tax=Actinoplanes sp. NPDC023801 TaxID=3154595 RepID=UPI0033CD0A10
MIRVALQTLRMRWVSFLGTIIALVLGVAQVAAMGLLLAAMVDLPDRPAERFARAPAVVLPGDPDWDPARHDLGVRSLPAAKGVSPELLARVSAVGPVVADRDFYAQMAGGPADQVGHPWPVAEFGGYRLTAGRAPAGGREIVVTGGSGARPGARVTVLTAGEVATYTVTGVAEASGYEDAVFFTDEEAARLSPRINALVALGPLPAVRAAVTGSDASVLTGRDRHRADASAARDRESFDDTVTLLPVMASVAGSTAIFVVASTFAFAATQRRREVALLRAVGTTPRQVHRMILSEAALVGTAGSLAGVLLGPAGTGLLVRWLVSLDIAPPWLGVTPSLAPAVVLPLVAAFLIGVFVALGGALAAAWRAGRVRPVEALRESLVDDTGMTPGRWLLGAAGLLTGVGLVAWIAVGSPGTVLVPNSYVPTLLTPVLAAALLAPVAVGPLTRVLMWPFNRSLGATAVLVRASALTARRRTAATAAPVLLTVGLALSVLGATDTVNEARDQGLRNQTSAEYAILPEGTPGLSQAIVAKVAAVPGVQVVAPIMTTVFTEDDGRLDENDGMVVDPVALAAVYRLQITGGSLAGFNDGAVVVPDVWKIDSGERMEILMADGTTANLEVAAVYHALRGQDVAFLPPRFAGTGRYARDGLSRRAYLAFAPGTDRDAAVAAVRAAVGGVGARVVTSAELVASESAWARHLIAVRQKSVAGIVVLFCFIAIVNTLLMATADRRRDLMVLRLAGATRRQVLTVFAAESVLVVGIGVLLALAASTINLGGLWVALTRLFGATPVVVPYGTILGITVIATILALTATLLPAGAALRRNASRSTSTRE